MSASAIEIRRLRADDVRAFSQVLATLPEDAPSFLQDYRAGQSLNDYRVCLAQREAGVALADGVVPSTLFFAFDGNALVGRCSIRHRLTPALAAYAGHVGYAVMPGWRRQGIATRLLQFAIAHAREVHGIDPVWVTCDSGNEASLGVIQRCGGVELAPYAGPLSPTVKRRFAL